MLDQVFDNIYIGESETVQKQDEVYKEEITTIVRLDQIPRTQGQWSGKFTLLDMPIPDCEYLEGDTIEVITAFMHKHIEDGKNVLVHCHMGISRSVSMVMAYLIEYESMSLAEAYGTVREGRVSAYPHDRLLLSLIDHYDLPYNPNTVYNPQFLAKLLEDV